MAVPVEITWVTGQVVTAAQLNSNVRDAVNFLVNPPMCEVHQTVAQSVAHGGALLLFDSEIVDTDGMHSTVSLTSRITAQTPGRYQIWGGDSWVSNATGTRGGWYMVNGVNHPATESIVPTASGIQISVPIRTRSVFMNAADYIELFGWQSSGAALNTTVGGQSNSHFGARYIGTT